MSTPIHPPELPIAAFRRALKAHLPQLVETTDKTPTAVAAILCPHQGHTHLLFIERTRCAGDPWSGHLAFPGGRHERGDADLRRTAERETWEEVRLDLAQAEYLGRLDDLRSTVLPVRVAAFAYALEQPVPLTLSAEVEDAFWVPLSALLDPARQRESCFPFPGLEDRRLPAIDLLGPGRPLLWGITYHFVAQLCRLAGHCLPRPKPSPSA